MSGSDAEAPRLLVVSSYFDTHRGGLEIVAGKLARHLSQCGFSVDWLATSATEAPRDSAVQCLPIKAWNVTERRLGIPFPLPGLGGLVRLGRAVRAADAVLLHDSLYPLSVATTLAALAHRKPLVICQHIGQVPYHQPLLRFLMAAANRLVARPVLARADQVVFISSFVRDFFAKVRFRRPPELIFNGVDTEVFAPGDRLAARQALNLPRDAKVALFVGRFVEKKGLHLLHEMAKRRPDVIWAFAGWGHIDPAHWGLANVRVLQGLSGASLADAYRAADVFILPSHGEGFPLVIQEALAVGLPVICGAESTTADPAAAPHLIGVDVEGDTRRVVEALLEACDGAFTRGADAEGAAQRRELATSRYAWAGAADRYAAILRRLIATNSSGRLATRLKTAQEAS